MNERNVVTNDVFLPHSEIIKAYYVRFVVGRDSLKNIPWVASVKQKRQKIRSSKF